MVEQQTLSGSVFFRSWRAATAVVLAAGGLGFAAYGWDHPAGRATELAYLALLAGGLVSGFFAGLLGIGGALVTIPVLYLALPGLGVAVPELPLVAASTALFAMVPTTLVAAHHQRLRGAVRLFETRARAAMPAFDLAAQATGVVRLVHAVDGLPLAIGFSGLP